VMVQNYICLVCGGKNGEHFYPFGITNHFSYQHVFFTCIGCGIRFMGDVSDLSRLCDNCKKLDNRGIIMVISELTWGVLKDQVHEWASDLVLEDEEIWDKVVTLMRDNGIIRKVDILP